MALHHPPGVHHLLAEGILPVAVRGNGLDLIEDGIDEAVEDVFLVPDVSVEGHRVDAELLAELAHAEGFDPATVGEVDRSLEHAFLGQGRTSLGFRSCLTTISMIHLRSAALDAPSPARYVYAVVYTVDTNRRSGRPT